ncbi:hypothetical protein RIF29_14484 [Crotalaria pallida]|uniref:Uncharacterized protein n=1 Tax=Crotalaria pallida TaxID=3830 RepID=A0AAN9FH53_CROPI
MMADRNLEKANSDDGGDPIIQGRANNSELTSKISGETEKESLDRNIISHAANSASPFGPWMLVKRYNKHNSRNNIKDQVGKIQSKIKGAPNTAKTHASNGSRFASLINDEDPHVEITDHQLNQQILQDEDQPDQKHIEARIRNTNGGKNPKIKNGNKALGPGPKPKGNRVTHLHNEGKQVQEGKSHQVTKEEINVISEEEKMRQKEKELETLRRMKILEKDKGLVLNQISTQVYLPSAEAINLIHQKSSIRSFGLSTSRPPDSHSEQSAMELDKSSPLGDGDAQMNEVVSSKKVGRQGKIPKPSQ